MFVDEAQDTNTSQFELLKLLVGDKSNLFLVGDPYQVRKGATLAAF